MLKNQPTQMENFGPVFRNSKHFIEKKQETTEMGKTKRIERNTQTRVPGSVRVNRAIDRPERKPLRY